MLIYEVTLDQYLGFSVIPKFSLYYFLVSNPPLCFAHKDLVNKTHLLINN